MEELLRLCINLSLQGDYHGIFNYSGHVDKFNVIIYSADSDYTGEDDIKTVYSVICVEPTRDNLIKTITEVKGYMK